MRRSTNTATSGGNAVPGTQLELEGMPAKPKKARFPMLETFERVKFIPAPEVEAIALELIPKLHQPRWKPYVPEIQYFFSGTAPKIGGQEKTAICKKVGGFAAYLRELERIQHQEPNTDAYNKANWLESFSDPEDYCLPEDRHLLKEKPFFCIIVHWHQWVNLDSDKRRALVDHELLHVGVEPGEKGPRFEVRPHTIEEFHELVRREGAWHDGLRIFAEMMEMGNADRKAAERTLPEGMTVTFKYGNNTVTLGKPGEILPPLENSPSGTAEGETVKTGEILPALENSPSTTGTGFPPVELLSAYNEFDYAPAEPAPKEPSPTELETCPLKVSTKLYSDLTSGPESVVFRHGGSHYYVVQVKGEIIACRVVPEDVWKKTYPGIQPMKLDWADSDKRDMLVTDTENEPWVIMANTRYQVQDITAEVGALEAAA